MALYGPSTATATVAANTNSVAVTGMDLTVVKPGMTINLGSRGRKVGDAWIIASVLMTDTNTGTITTVESIPTVYNNAAFVIDTTGYLGTDASYAAVVGLAILNTLTTLLGVATNLYSGARQLVLDKVASSALSRIVFATAGRTWGDLVHREHSFTPTGGVLTKIEAMVLRAFSDGTSPTDALLIDLTNGTGDLRKGSVTMASAATVDLGSAPAGKVAITGAATIASFGPGRHLDRLVHIVDGGVTLKHSASLILPSGQDIVTAAGDCFHVTSDGLGNWRLRQYQRADGSPTVPWARLVAANGYVRFPFGLILQWGVSNSVGTDYTQPFPIAFPNACLFVSAGVRFAPNTSTAFATHVHTFSPTGFSVANRYTVANSVGVQGGLPVSFLAIGW